MTPSELTEIIATQLKAVGDFTFKRTVLARADAIRAQQLKRTLEKQPADRKFFTQEIQVPMTNFNSIEGVGDLKCIWSKSTCSLPRPLRANSILFDYVGSVDGSNPYRWVNRGSERFLRTGAYGNKSVFYHRDANRLVVQKAGVPRILVIGIFADTEDAYNIDAKTRGCKDCDFWESEYPCTEDVIDIIIKEIVQEWRETTVNLEANGTQNQPDPTA